MNKRGLSKALLLHPVNTCPDLNGEDLTGADLTRSYATRANLTGVVNIGDANRRKVTGVRKFLLAIASVEFLLAIALVVNAAYSQEPTTTTVPPVITTVPPVVATVPPVITTVPPVVATVPPTPVVNTPKPAPTVVREDRRFSGYTDGPSRHECRHFIYYSDGTSTSSRYWVASGSGFNKWAC